MKRFIVGFTLSMSVLAAGATQREIGGQVVGHAADSTPRDVAADFAVRDVRAAATRAEDYFTKSGSSWENDVRPFRAESVVFSRAPVASGDMLKVGDPIWIVVVVNDAQSSVLQIPVGIVWVRAKDGAVFVSGPKGPNQTPEPTPTAVTPRADARVAPAAVVAHL